MTLLFPHTWKFERKFSHTIERNFMEQNSTQSYIIQEGYSWNNLFFWRTRSSRVFKLENLYKFLINLEIAMIPCYIFHPLWEKRFESSKVLTVFHILQCYVILVILLWLIYKYHKNLLGAKFSCLIQNASPILQ